MCDGAVKRKFLCITILLTGLDDDFFNDVKTNKLETCPISLHSPAWPLTVFNRETSIRTQGTEAARGVGTGWTFGNE